MAAEAGTAVRGGGMAGEPGREGTGVRPGEGGREFGGRALWRELGFAVWMGCSPRVVRTRSMVGYGDAMALNMGMKGRKRQDGYQGIVMRGRNRSAVGNPSRMVATRDCA